MKSNEQYIAEIYEKYNKIIEKRRKRNAIIIKSCIAIFVCVIVIIGSSSIARKLNHYSFEEDDIVKFDGARVAIENGYIENIDMDYIYSDDLGIKVTRFMMDDYNLYFEMKINSEKEFSEELVNIDLNGILIYDENNNIIYCRRKEQYEEYCKKNGKDIDFDEYGKKESNLNYEEFDIIEKYNNRAIVRYKIRLNEKLNAESNVCLNFEYISLGLKSIDNEFIFKKYCNFKEDIIINIPENMKNIKYYEYIAEENENIKLKECKIGNISSKVVFGIQEKELDNIKNKFKRIRIELGNNIQYVRKINFIDSGIEMFLEINKYNCTDNMKIVFELEDKEIAVNIRRKDA